MSSNLSGFLLSCYPLSFNTLSLDACCLSFGCLLSGNSIGFYPSSFLLG